MKNLKIRIETKLENYVKIVLVQKQIFLPSGEILPLEEGVAMKENQFFGFKIKQDVGMRIKSYKTNEGLVGIDYDKTEKQFRIYEGHKFLPWVFDEYGNLIDVAQFLPSSRRDCSFLWEEFGIDTKQKIDAWNNLYIKRYQKKEKM